MKNLIFMIALISISVLGCKEWQRNAGAEAIEQGVVLGKSFKPYESSIGAGMSMSGKLVMTSSSSPESYNVVFHCFDHDAAFNIESQALYERLFEGDTVDITYCPVSDGNGKIRDIDFTVAFKKSNSGSY